MKTRLKYVQRFRDRNGKMRHYYRRGTLRIALPDPADGMGAFLAAYTAAASGEPVRRTRTDPVGTLAHVITLYLKSRKFGELKPNSKATYMHAIEFLRARPSVNAHVSAFDEVNIDGLIDELAAETPGKARLVLKVMRALMKVAKKHKFITVNPTDEIEMPAGGSYRAWTDDELLRFERRWPSGTRERLVYEIALRTGYRRGDIARLSWVDVKGGKIRIEQEKTGTLVLSVIAPALARELDLTPKRQAVVVTTEKGLPFASKYLGTWFAEAIEKAGLPDDCVMHGLRKTFAKRMAEAGASDRQIMASTGHRTPGMVALYTQQADRERMAEQAFEAVERADQERRNVKLANPAKNAE